ncbi:hypothetical protein ACQE3D_10615 [Methylomonas sp. MS20]|uniref:hypothetical protein n=1 Tax=unclassified Methylomonas TaxID=2608980 RepID=UPI0028A4D6EF|nr:hypothetical protein [Methylomonas sp. MV1]MDT4328551.1 hypothetical protein [Methylomonas sp. MV1]
MIVKTHTPAEFAAAQSALLPPGIAWQWPAGGFGRDLLTATGAELARVEAATQAVLDAAIELHRPAVSSWHISEYRRVAADAVAGVSETMPRKMFAVGSRVGDRLWSAAGPAATFPVELVQVDHLATKPMRVGSRVGDRCWGHRGRYILRVRYYRSVVDPEAIFRALREFKQAHVYLWFEDITGSGGEVNYAQD